MLNILIISDEAKNIAALFKSTGFTPDTQDAKRTGAPLEGGEPSWENHDIAFLDLDTENWQERLLDARHSMPVIAFSHPDLHKAVEALKLGAGDYLEKPLTADVVSEVIGRHKKRILSNKYGFDEIIGNSAPMQEVFGLIKKAAASESNMLITGESGTGKELIARAIHRWSPRSEKSFTTINCTAIPDTLLESELFGFEKGSFTGAVADKKGLVEEADKGTLFLDEIGELAPQLQVKLLRILQEGEFTRIGDTLPRRVNVRVIAATNRDLKKSIAEKMFREDLFYRLNVIPIELPPLRRRTEDIPLLANHFVGKHKGKAAEKNITGIAKDALQALVNYHFPGNVRELENSIEYAIAFTAGPAIQRDELPKYILEEKKLSEEARTIPLMPLKDAKHQFERSIIMAALIESGGNISEAARLLHIHRQNLQQKIHLLGIDMELISAAR